MNTRQAGLLAALLTAGALACGDGSNHPSASACHLVGFYDVTASRTSADGLCDVSLESFEMGFEIEEDSPGTFKMTDRPVTASGETTWLSGSIDGNCDAHLDRSETEWFEGPEGQEARRHT